MSPAARPRIVSETPRWRRSWAPRGPFSTKKDARSSEPPRWRRTRLNGSAMSQEPRCEAKHRFRGSAMAQEPGASRALLDQEPLLGNLEASLNLIGILFAIFHQFVSGVFGVVCRIADPARVRWVAAHEEPPHRSNVWQRTPPSVCIVPWPTTLCLERVARHHIQATHHLVSHANPAMTQGPIVIEPMRTPR